MTSTGNTAQKNLIDKLIKASTQTQQRQVITQAINTAQSGEEKRTLKAIAKKFRMCENLEQYK